MSQSSIHLSLSSQESTSDLRRYWMPDKACKECSECSSKFSWFLRRHHCRICGRIFCNACCYKTIPGGMLRSDLQVSGRQCVCVAKRERRIEGVRRERERERERERRRIGGKERGKRIRLYLLLTPGKP